MKEQQKVALTEQIHGLSAQNNNQTAEIDAHKTQIYALSDKTDGRNQHLRVTFESCMKLQNQSVERKLAVARSEARMSLTLNSEPEKSFYTSWWTSSVGIKNTLSKTLVERTKTDGETQTK